MKIYFEGLTCANCAGKIERIVGKMANIKEASVSLATGTLSIEEDVGFSEEKIFEEVVKLVNELEPHVVVSRKKASRMVEQESCGCDGHDHSHKEGNGTCSEDGATMLKIYFEGLTCANCAGKIERIVHKMPNVKEASVSLATGTLSIEAEDGFSEEKTFEAVVKLVNELEPHVVVSRKKASRMVETESCGCDGQDHQQSLHHSHGSCDGTCSSEIVKSKQKKVNKKAPKQEGGMGKRQKIELLSALVLFLGGFLTKLFLPADFYSVAVGLFLGAYVLSGYHIVLLALKNIRRGQVLDESFLMTIATLGALIIGEWPEAAGVMIFYGVGEYFQAKAVDSARNSIGETIHFNAESAHIVLEQGIKTVKAAMVKKGDILLVKPGEKVPADGIVVEGLSYLDTSPLTGESYPRRAAKGDEVLSGMINGNAVIKMQITKDFEDSTAVKIMHLIEEASDKKGKTEKFITKFSRYYTPIIVVSAIMMAILPPVLIAGANFEEWLYRSLIFLVVSCPCALVLSIPISYFGGIGRASKEGILIKGGNYLDVLYQADTFVFDKTGTLTRGAFSVLQMELAEGLDKNTFMEAVSAGEYYSNHPIAEAVRKFARVDIPEKVLQNHQEIPGKGTQVSWNHKTVLVGKRSLLTETGIKTPISEKEGTLVYVAIDGVYAGYLVLGDEIKENAYDMISGLKKMGIKQTVMLSGDNEETAQRVGRMLGIDQIVGECLPQDKVRAFEKIQKKKNNKKTIYVGDGMNDAPVLAMADAGMAMGGFGSDAAIEAADIILMKDDPLDILKSVDIAKFTRKIMIQNIVFALGIKILVLGLTVLGMGEMYQAIFADVGAAVLTILNTMRILKYKGRYGQQKFLKRDEPILEEV